MALLMLRARPLILRSKTWSFPSIFSDFPPQTLARDTSSPSPLKTGGLSLPPGSLSSFRSLKGLSPNPNRLAPEHSSDDIADNTSNYGKKFFGYWTASMDSAEPPRMSVSSCRAGITLNHSASPTKERQLFQFFLCQPSAKR